MNFTNSRLPRVVAMISVMLFCVMPAKADLIGHWTFDDQTAEDASGNSNDGELEGVTLPTYSQDVPPNMTGGFSLSLAGGDGHVLVPHADSAASLMAARGAAASR